MTRPALRTDRRAARWPRLLLLAALLLGIVTMHTLGHPSRSHTMQDAAPAAAVASAGRAADHTPGTATAPAHASHDRGPAAEAPPPGTGMDPMSVCLAVLGGLTLLILGAGPAGFRDAAPLGGAARRPGRSGGPDPPSPRELLTRLAVLRV
ncbi:hypothetical protein ACIGBH_04955 [Streptomyces sp. NPDC085929]|uniref:hypothetical protein n=1 Tax=Streptomyces sp. NPDC085929 TaxID=3365739 RepID=UPI0037D6FFBB